jgi:hypothetical protein
MTIADLGATGLSAFGSRRQPEVFRTKMIRCIISELRISLLIG